MCPSIAVMGGGAGGGGGSGDGAGNGDGSGPGDGDGSGDGANGDGSGAGTCGNGANAACTNCQAGTAAGDPVNVVSGEVFTIPKTDLLLPGFFELEILRSYSSNNRKHDVGMGWGWTHSLAWSMNVGRSRIVVRSGRGQVMTFPLLEPGDSFNVDGWALLRTTGGYVLRAGDEFFHLFTDDAEDPEQPKLAAIKYRNRGAIELFYRDGRLARVVDTAGRQIIFTHQPGGQITSISVPDSTGQAIVFARYRYDDGGHLVEAVDADNNAVTYSYDDDRRLIRMGLPNGLRFCFNYDRQGRCVETWGERDTPDPALDPAAPDLLADGLTKAKGVFHAKLDFSGEGYSEVVDSVRVQRFFSSQGGHASKAITARGGVITRKTDDHDRIVAQTDANGVTWTYAYDRLGNVVEQRDGEDRRVLLRRDSEGRITEMVDPAGGKIEHGRDRYGNLEWVRDQKGAVTQFRYDARGMITDELRPDGTRVRFQYDAQGNLATIQHADGGVTRRRYDYWGRQVHETLPDGRHFTQSFSPGGRLLERRDNLGRTLAFTYDSLGNVTTIKAPDGGLSQFAYGGLGWRYSEQAPDGTSIRGYFNREGWLTKIENEKRETHELTYSRSGRIAEERWWNGRWRRFKHDARDQVIAIEDDRGKTEIERNKVGQLTKLTAPDGSTRTYEYDMRGKLVAATSNGVSLQWTRDAVGEIVQERQTFSKISHAVDNMRDMMGRRVGLSSSLGLGVQAKRDVRGEVSELWVGDERTVAFSRDATGWPVRRDFPRGGAVVDELDGATRLRRRSVLDANAPVADRDKPERIGGVALEIDKRYQYSDVDEVVSVTTAADGTTEYEYDLKYQLLAKRSRAGDERFRVDESGNHADVGPAALPRRYEAGGKLVERGPTEYIHDSRGLLKEKRTRRDDGKSDRMLFSYDGWDLLKGIDLPDGRRLEFAYDAFARRIEKKVFRKTPTGKREVLSTTRYVWDLMSLLHEVETRKGRAPEVRSYLYEDNDEVTPIAQRTTSGLSSEEWLHYVGDLNETPEELVDGSGKVVGRLRRSAYGVTTTAAGSTASTPFRFPGQVADPETGLHYNRYRYYDPEAGRYITPDPIGIVGGWNLYQYGQNPIGWIDPMGWAHHMTVDSFTRRGGGNMPNRGIRDEYVSGMSDDEDAPNFADEDVRNRATCHTERKLLHDLEENYSPSELRGSTLNVTGEYPPCPNCHRAMLDFAERNNMTINYRYGPNGEHSVRYRGGEATGNSSRSERLCDAYAMTSTGTGGGAGASSLNPTERYTFDNWDGAMDEYRDQRRMARAGR